MVKLSRNIAVCSAVVLIAIILCRSFSEVLIWSAASSSHDKKYISALVWMGANVNAKDKGVPLLVYATECWNAEAVEVFLEYGADPEAVMSVRRNNYRKQTALMIAAGEGFDDIVVLLLKKGAKVDTKDARGYDMYWYAKDYPKTLKLLPFKKQSSKATAKGK